MEFVKQSAEEWKQKSFDFFDILSHIERCGRICYKSKSDLTKETAIKFYEMITKRKHFSVEEHASIILDPDKSRDYKFKPKVGEIDFMDGFYTNFRNFCYTATLLVIAEHYKTIKEAYEDLKAKEDVVNLRKTIHIITDRATAQQLTRHRAFSFSMESQRYCNYKGGLEFIMQDGLVGKDKLLLEIEKTYQDDVNNGVRPEIARAILPNCTKTELVMTGYFNDWRKFLDERLKETTGKVSPTMKELATKISAFIYH